MNLPTPYSRLHAHVARHAYRRGAFVGDAPLNPSRRARNHERVVLDSPGAIAVRRYRTDILTAYPDGTVRLSMGGWSGSPTTRACLNHALYKFMLTRVQIYTGRVFGLSQLILATQHGMYCYYDGITLTPDGAILNPTPFLQKRADRAERAELRAALTASGFADAFPLLYASVEPGYPRLNTPDVRRMVSLWDADNPYTERWPDVVQWSRRLGPVIPAADAYRRLVRVLCADLTTVGDSPYRNLRDVE